MGLRNTKSLAVGFLFYFLFLFRGSVKVSTTMMTEKKNNINENRVRRAIKGWMVTRSVRKVYTSQLRTKYVLIYMAVIGGPCLFFQLMNFPFTCDKVLRWYVLILKGSCPDYSDDGHTCVICRSFGSNDFCVESISFACSHQVSLVCFCIYIWNVNGIPGKRQETEVIWKSYSIIVFRGLILHLCVRAEIKMSITLFYIIYISMKVNWRLIGALFRRKVIDIVPHCSCEFKNRYSWELIQEGEQTSEIGKIRENTQLEIMRWNIPY